MRKFLHGKRSGSVQRIFFIAFQHHNDRVEILIDTLRVLFNRRVRVLFALVLNRIHLLDGVVHCIQNLRIPRFQKIGALMIQIAK